VIGAGEGHWGPPAEGLAGKPENCATTMSDDLEYTVKQAARELQKPERTIRDWLQRGKLGGRQIRGKRGLEWRVYADSMRAKKAASDAAGGKGDAAKLNAAGGGDYAALLDVVRSLREENLEYRAYLERLTLEIAGLRETLQRLLPPAPEPRRPWWRFGR